VARGLQARWASKGQLVLVVLQGVRGFPELPDCRETPGVWERRGKTECPVLREVEGVKGEQEQRECLVVEVGLVRWVELV